MGAFRGFRGLGILGQGFGGLGFWCFVLKGFEGFHVEGCLRVSVEGLYGFSVEGFSVAGFGAWGSWS